MYIYIYDCQFPVKKLRAICDLSGAVAHLFLFGTPIGSWRFSILLIFMGKEIEEIMDFLTIQVGRLLKHVM